MFSKSIGILTISRLRLFHIVLLTTKPVIWDVLRTWEATIRAIVLPRVIFLEVCRLELRDYILRMISILRSGCLEISLNSLSCPIFGYLPGCILSEKYMQNGIFFIYLECCKGFNDVDIQNIHECLLGVGHCKGCELQATVEKVQTHTFF